MKEAVRFVTVHMLAIKRLIERFVTLSLFGVSILAHLELKSNSVP